MTAVLEARDLARSYTQKRGLFSKPATVKALAGVSFSLNAGETLAIVGESGSGKSTLARLLTLIEPPTSGELWIDGVPAAGAGGAALKSLRSKLQIVFQNPYGSLNPRHKIGQALEEPLLVNTDLPANERQRIAIARALMLRPKILVLDEPVSALDVSIRAQVLNLLADLQDEFKLAYVFISHDLSVVRHIANRVMVIYLGKAVETGTREVIFSGPRHPYTRALLSSTPVADPLARKERIILKGELPSPFDPPGGCAFHPRCPMAFARCREEAPRPEMKQGRLVACWAVGEAAA